MLQGFDFDVILDIYFLSLSPADRGGHDITSYVYGTLVIVCVCVCVITNLYVPLNSVSHNNTSNKETLQEIAYFLLT